ncbi:hypothetical protein BT67DRAFT_42580 [Trichocladium antarcticum]|uniref:Uncharacterized protein n=1 Tax=Trichocladium antarcticum TaxID=1450529 RepID=A0AAN6ZC91_9PEZI|nr:hypothetical protein BT67DRAFT_42580 [Trichocladium antarcticum]
MAHGPPRTRFGCDETPATATPQATPTAAQPSASSRPSPAPPPDAAASSSVLPSRHRHPHPDPLLQQNPAPGQERAATSACLSRARPPGARRHHLWRRGGCKRDVNTAGVCTGGAGGGGGVADCGVAVRGASRQLPEPGLAPAPGKGRGWVCERLVVERKVSVTGMYIHTKMRGEAVSVWIIYASVFDNAFLVTCVLARCETG